jgi:hypothetical protein
MVIVETQCINYRVDVREPVLIIVFFCAGLNSQLETFMSFQKTEENFLGI